MGETISFSCSLSIVSEPLVRLQQLLQPFWTDLPQAAQRPARPDPKDIF